VTLPPHEPVAAFAAAGIRAFVTTRDAGSFGLPDAGQDAEAEGRWLALQRALGEEGTPGLVSARQVHGTRVLVHGDVHAWKGLLRIDGADAHVLTRGGAAAITIADCVPVFLAKPGGPVAVVHAGWRGVADRILAEAVRALGKAGAAPAELVMHCGPSICGRCYEVGPDVYEKLTGFATKRPRQVDLRSLLAEQAKELGIARWSASGDCTRCDNDRFFSHRAGDAGRQVAVILQA
jgi:YfiH family protein